MVDFGYTAHHDRQIDFDRNDKRVLEHLKQHEPSVLTCIACGGCTATCTAGHFTGFNIRLVQTLLRRGEIEPVKQEIGKCMLCGKCQLVCPRGVHMRNMILAIQTAITKLK
jgi:heterodisulfide reductase subunit C